MSSQRGPPSASGRAADRKPPKAGASGGRGRGAGEGRGQTTLDFTIGVSVFLSVMLFVFAFVPGILQPFNLSGEENIAMSDRIASDLSQSLLGNASTPYVLESSCTRAFFDEGAAPPGHCNYDEGAAPPGHCNYGGSDIHERLGIDDTHNLNVTIEGALSGGRSSTLLCWDDDGEDLEEVDGVVCSDPDDQILAAGGTPPVANDATVTSRRVVSLHQQNVTLQVVVW